MTRTEEGWIWSGLDLKWVGPEVGWLWSGLVAGVVVVMHKLQNPLKMSSHNGSSARIQVF